METSTNMDDLFASLSQLDNLGLNEIKTVTNNSINSKRSLLQCHNNNNNNHSKGKSLNELLGINNKGQQQQSKNQAYIDIWDPLKQPQTTQVNQNDTQNNNKEETYESSILKKINQPKPKKLEYNEITEKFDFLSIENSNMPAKKTQEMIKNNTNDKNKTKNNNNESSESNEFDLLNLTMIDIKRDVSHSNHSIGSVSPSHSAATSTIDNSKDKNMIKVNQHIDNIDPFAEISDILNAVTESSKPIENTQEKEKHNDKNNKNNKNKVSAKQLGSSNSSPPKMPPPKPPTSSKVVLNCDPRWNDLKRYDDRYIGDAGMESGNYSLANKLCDKLNIYDCAKIAIYHSNKYARCYAALFLVKKMKNPRPDIDICFEMCKILFKDNNTQIECMAGCICYTIPMSRIVREFKYHIPEHLKELCNFLTELKD